MRDPILAPYLERWCLTPDGAVITTRAARLLPVRQRGGEPAMLRIVTLDDAKGGEVLLEWWDGHGAARVYEKDGDALLLERATGPESLMEFVRTGRDDEATGILCAAVSVLHEPRDKRLPDLIPLPVWFEALAPVARAHGGLLARAHTTAQALLIDQHNVVPLHGDIHHENVLDFGRRGWLAIDPNRLIGDRAFDYANIFCNPDLGDQSLRVARDPTRFRRRLEIVVARSGIEKPRLLRWILAWCGLSAAWFINDGESAEIDLAVAEMAAAALDRGTDTISQARRGA